MKINRKKKKDLHKIYEGKSQIKLKLLFLG